MSSKKAADAASEVVRADWRVGMRPSTLENLATVEAALDGGYNDAQIAKMIGLTCERVRQLREKLGRPRVLPASPVRDRITAAANASMQSVRVVTRSIGVATSRDTNRGARPSPTRDAIVSAMRDLGIATTRDIAAAAATDENTAGVTIHRLFRRGRARRVGTEPSRSRPWVLWELVP